MTDPSRDRSDRDDRRRTGDDDEAYYRDKLLQRRREKREGSPRRDSNNNDRNNNNRHSRRPEDSLDRRRRPHEDRDHRRRDYHRDDDRRDYDRDRNNNGPPPPQDRRNNGPPPPHDRNNRDHDNRGSQQQQQRREPPRPQSGLRPGISVRGKISRIENYGAFCDIEGHDDPNSRRPPRGLVHISQLAVARVEQVTDVVQVGQTVHCAVLDLQDGRIRLAMVGVNQETGEIDQAVLRQQQERGGQRDNNGGGGQRGGGGRMLGDRQQQQRAQDRVRMFRQATAGKTWRDAAPPQDDRRAGSRGRDQSNTSHLRLLWSASPDPPSQVTAVAKKPARGRSESSGSSSSGSSSDSSDSDSSSEESRRRSSSRRRKRGRDSRKRSSRSRRSRRRSPSSSSSSSSSSGSYSSSSESSRGDKKRSRKDGKPTEIITATTTAAPDSNTPNDAEMRDAVELKQAVQGGDNDSSDDDNVGPMPLPMSNAAMNTSADGAAYGQALLPGEGQAIAQYVQQNLRIPRRGEIGYSSEAIDKYENSGFVMSGSRHAKMNAVRIRKENQVYSAEEQRALALITAEENQQKETALMEDFRIMLKEKERQRDLGDKGDAKR